MPQVKSKSRNQGPEPDAPDAQVESAADFGRERTSVSKRKPSGTKVSLPQPIHRAIGKFASGFCEKYGFMDRPTAECIARLIRISITPRSARGRKATQTVITAARLLQQKVPWSEIYVVVIPGHGDMPKFERECRTRQLRRNVNRFLKRRGIQSPVPPGRSRKGSKKPTSD